MAETVKSDSFKLGFKLIPALITAGIGIIIWFIPPPEGVNKDAWHLLAIFIATIVGIITKPMPMGAVALIGISMTSITKVLDTNASLSGFSNSVIWLIVAAFFISRGFIKTGLGNRIAFFFMRLLGKRTLGLSYGLIATDLVLAPAIPSNTARAGGVVYPILQSVSETYNSKAEDNTSNRIASFLTFASFQGTIITSAMFLTAMAANPLAVEFAEAQGVKISWAKWATAAIVPGIVSLLLVPYIIYKLYPPEIKETPEASLMAQQKLEEMGKVKTAEWLMLGTFILLLVLWIFGEDLEISSTSAALFGLAVLLLTGVLTWDDILKEREAWNTLIWFSALVMMASNLTKLGLIAWFSDEVGSWFEDIDWKIAFLAIAIIYFYSHYFFASNTAHVSSMYAAFLAIAIVVGTPALLAALVLAFFSNLFSSMTHYGTGPAPVFYGSNHVKLNDWWKLGFMLSLLNIAIWLIIGGLWWKILGYW